MLLRGTLLQYFPLLIPLTQEHRSFAILRHKPLTLQKTPAFPSTLHPYENPEIHTGFMHLVNSYHLLDSSFVDSWNESTSAPASTLTYTTLQQQLSLPSHATEGALTSIQKADILITQQWLRLIIWQSSMRQGLLSSHAEEESMTFAYPLKIAHSLLNVISSLPTTSIEVHGMGIFEKIFEIGNTMLDVLHAYGGVGGALEGLGDARGVVQDPFEVFVKTLSQNPNSQRQYASLLLQKAAEKPSLGMGLSPNPSSFLPVSAPGLGLGLDFGNANVNANGEVGAMDMLGAVGMGEGVGRRWRGSIVGEIEDDGTYKVHDQGQGVTDVVDNTQGWRADEVLVAANTGWMSGSDDESGHGSLLINDGMDGMDGWLKME